MDDIFLNRVDSIQDDRFALGALLRAIDAEKRTLKRKHVEQSGKKRSLDISVYREAMNDLKEKRQYVTTLVVKLKNEEKAQNRAARLPLEEAKAFVAAAELVLKKDQLSKIREEASRLRLQSNCLKNKTL